VQCRDLMRTDVETLLPTDTAQAAAQRMREANIGFLPVCDRSMRVLGTLTDRDIALRLVADSLPAWTTIAVLMTPEVVACAPGDDLGEAERLMGERQKSRLLCVDDHTRLLGVISLSDIARVEDDAQAAATLRQVTEREARAM
jgi:CBS domain-containing protein